MFYLYVLILLQSREIPDIIPPVLQQHNQQRLMNLSQMQYPQVQEQRTCK